MFSAIQGGPVPMRVVSENPRVGTNDGRKRTYREMEPGQPTTSVPLRPNTNIDRYPSTIQNYDARVQPPKTDLEETCCKELWQLWPPRSPRQSVLMNSGETPCPLEEIIRGCIFMTL
ncbi:unnamed protein product, partial [Gordionus sp. m RMFG-2023]